MINSNDFIEHWHTCIHSSRIRGHSVHHTCLYHYRGQLNDPGRLCMSRFSSSLFYDPSQLVLGIRCVARSSYIRHMGTLLISGDHLLDGTSGIPSVVHAIGGAPINSYRKVPAHSKASLSISFSKKQRSFAKNQKGIHRSSLKYCSFVSILLSDLLVWVSWSAR